MLDFPNSPTNGQIFQNWQWDGTKWTQGASASPVVNSFNNRTGAVTLTTSDVTAVADATYVNISGDTMTGGLNFGSAIAPGGDTDLSRHITLYNPSYGFSITSDTLNHVSGGSNQNFYINSAINAVMQRGRFVVRAPGADISVALWREDVGCAGILYGGNGELIFANMDGNGVYVGTRGYFSSGNDFYSNGAVTGTWFHSTGGMQIDGDSVIHNTYCDGGLGIRYRNFSGNWFAFGWNGRVQCWVDGGGAYVEFRTTADYCPNQNVDAGSAPSFAPVYSGYGDRAHWFSGDVAGFYWNSGNGIAYLRWNNGWDYPLSGASDIRLKDEIAPSTFDCLDAIKRMPLAQFRWRDLSPERRQKFNPGAGVGPIKKIGLIAQQVAEVVPEFAIPGEKNLEADPKYTDENEVVHLWTIDTFAVLAALCGAVQQLSERMDGIE